METILVTALIVLVTLAALGLITGWRNSGGDRAAGLQLLPGDFKYESPSGNVRIYFPIATSIVLSIVLSLILGLMS